MTIALALAGLLLAMAIYLFIAPVSISLRAPDSGDIFLLRVRHAALSLDVWLPPEVLLRWAIGQRPLPGISGWIAGIPFDGETVAPLANRALAYYSGRKPRPPKPVRTPRPARPWLTIGREVLPRAREAGRIDALSVDLEFGTGDAASTGMISAALWQLATWMPEPFEIRAQPWWTEPRFHLTGEGRVLIFPWRAVLAILCLSFAMWRKRPGSQAAPPPTRLQEA